MPHAARKERRLVRLVRVSPPAETLAAQPAPGRPIRVLVVAARFLPELGGVENHVHEIASRIARDSDFELTVLATDRSGNLPIREDFQGFTVLRCRAYPRHRDYYFAPGVYQHIRDGSYDLVHCQGIHTAVPVLAMLAALRKGTPYVVTLHTGGHSSSFRNSIRNIQWRTLKPLLQRAEIVVAVSRFERQIFQETCRIDLSRFRVVQNGGDLPSIASRPEPVKNRIVSSGRLEHYKGHQRVIEALPIVQQSIPDTTLRILGAGPYEDELRTLSKKLGVEKSVTIEYISPGDRRLMAESLSKASVFAAFSEYEAHPVAVMEALSLGIPAIGLDTAGVGNLVEDGLMTGVPRDASAATIAQALLRVLDGASPDTARSLPTWDTAAAEVARFYRDAVKTGPNHHHPDDV